MIRLGSGWVLGPATSKDRLRRRACVLGPYVTTLVKPNAGPACDVDSSVTNIDVKEPSSYHSTIVQVALCDGR